MHTIILRDFFETCLVPKTNLLVLATLSCTYVMV